LAFKILYNEQNTGVEKKWQNYNRDTIIPDSRRVILSKIYSFKIYFAYCVLTLIHIIAYFGEESKGITLSKPVDSLQTYSLYSLFIEFYPLYFTGEILRQEQQSAMKERQELLHQMEEHRRLETERISRIRTENRQYQDDLEQQIIYQRKMKDREIGEARRELENIHVSISSSFHYLRMKF